MWQMVRSCDRSQRRLAAFLIVVVVLEVYAISWIIEHEHSRARADHLGGKKTTLSSVGVTKFAGERNKSILLGNAVVVRETQAHFSLGNDYAPKLSSYQTDFCVSNMRPFDSRNISKPPPNAEIHPRYVDERNKWVSSTKRDFISFGDEARKHCYESSRLVFTATKREHTSDPGILNDERQRQERMLSNYLKDYRQQPFIPHNMKMAKPQLKGVLNTTEARHSYQWPSKDGIRIPKHLQILS